MQNAKYNLNLTEEECKFLRVCISNTELLFKYFMHGKDEQIEFAKAMLQKLFDATHKYDLD